MEENYSNKFNPHFQGIPAPKVIDKSLDERMADLQSSMSELQTTLSNHLTTTFTIINEANDAVRSLEQGLKVLERVVQGVLATSYDTRNQASNRDIPRAYSTGGGGIQRGHAEGGCSLPRSEGSSINEHREEEGSREGSKGVEDQGQA